MEGALFFCVSYMMAIDQVVMIGGSKIQNACCTGRATAGKETQKSGIGAVSDNS